MLFTKLPFKMLELCAPWSEVILLNFGNICRCSWMRDGESPQKYIQTKHESHRQHRIFHIQLSHYIRTLSHYIRCAQKKTLSKKSETVFFNRCYTFEEIVFLFELISENKSHFCPPSIICTICILHALQICRYVLSCLVLSLNNCYSQQFSGF